MNPLSAFPFDFVHRFEQLIPPSGRAEAISGLTTKRVTTLRANTLKTDGTTLQKDFSVKGIRLIPVAWSPDAFIVKDTPLRDITETSEYAEGKLYVQSLSSMIPPVVLNPKPGDKVLDIAAAPGSKTTQMASLMKNTGQILANDSSQTRSYRLVANLKTQGVTIAAALKLDGRGLWTKYPEYFDKTLVDVPCSMDGRFYTEDPATFEDWSLKKVRDLAHLQRTLLRSAISSTKPGGTIVYSTCTLSPEENEDVIDWILKKEPGVVSVEEIILPNAPLAPALASWAGKQFHAEITKTARIYPSPTMEGFYVAKLCKLKTSIPKVLSDQY